MINTENCIIIKNTTFQPVNQKKRYQIHLKSHAGPIYVLLVNKDTDATSPVVVQVPPPRDDAPGLPDGGNQNQDPQPPLTRAGLATKAGAGSKVKPNQGMHLQTVLA